MVTQDNGYGMLRAVALTQSKVNKIVAQFDKWREENRKELARKSRPKTDSVTRVPIKNVNASEAAFVEKMKEKDAVLYRAGWPDFFVELPDKTIAVEIKQGSDYVRPNQRRMFAALERVDLPVFVWNPAVPGRLIPWREYDTDSVSRYAGSESPSDCAAL